MTAVRPELLPHRQLLALAVVAAPRLAAAPVSGAEALALQLARAFVLRLPRGGLLIGASLAGRAPPLFSPPDKRPWSQQSRKGNSRSKQMRTRRGLTSMALAVTALVATPATSQAHITVNPKQTPAGQFTELLVRVPNEKDNANTIKVDLKFPPGFAFASYEPRPGWRVKVIKQKPAKPLQTPHGPVNEQVSEIVWTGDGSALGRIGPGQFMDFPLSVLIPDKPGQVLTFKAIQTYDDGDVVRWIGPPEAEKPAPQVMLTKASESAAHGAMGAVGGASNDKSAASDDSGSASKGLGIAALVLGALGLLTGGPALWVALSRRRTATSY